MSGSAGPRRERRRDGRREDATTAHLISHHSSLATGHEAPRSDFLERRQGQLPCAAPQPVVVRRGRHDHDVRRGRRTKPVAWTAARRSSRRRLIGLGLHALPGPRLVGDLRGRLSPGARATRGRSASRHVIFGDIMYDSNREFPERVCAAEGLTAVEPLWGEPTAALYREFVAHRRRRAHRDRPRRRARPVVAGPTAHARSAGRHHGRRRGPLRRARRIPHGRRRRAAVLERRSTSSPLDNVCRDGCWAVDLALDDQPADRGDPCCSASELSYGYSSGGRRARSFSLDNVSVTVERGSLTGLLGPNGCGKTTLLNLLSGVLQPHHGVVVAERRRRWPAGRGVTSPGILPSSRRRRIPPSTTR